MKRPFLWGLVAPALLRGVMPRWLVESPFILAARHPWIALGVAIAVLGTGALAVVVAGIVPMKASTGHWAVTEQFLHFAMRRSVVTHAMLIETPPLDDPALVLRGAGHYEIACRACHGGAEGEMPMIPAAIVPPPRQLKVHAADWEPKDLFYIVKHGMKFSGMPAWPAQQRDDEVWAMVAFLRRLPSLSGAEYERLVRGETNMPLDLPTEPLAEGSASAPPPEIVTENCARCHGLDGNGRGTGAFPKLAGQRSEYLDRALRAYAEKRRHSGIMGPIAAALTSEARQQAVQHYASLPPPGPAMAGGPGDASRGAELALTGAPGQMIPACVECHGPAGAPKNPAFPRLAGQYAEYLAEQLRLLRDGQRGGSDYVHLMHAFAERLTDDHIQDVARYFASTAP